MSDDFYERLPVRTRFADITDPAAYTSVPADWHLALTDVRHSTQAIRAGRYKEVNLIGAASIIALLNLTPETDLPFVFGGDGATFLLPSRLVPDARAVLADTCRMARDEFNLELRAALVPVKTVLDTGHDLRVARFQIDEDCHQAMFDGGGLAFAERLVKNPHTAERYTITPASGNEAADYTGLECRWQDVPSPHGETVTLLVTATTGAPATDRVVYDETLRHIETLYGDVEAHRPVSVGSLYPSFSTEKLAHEARVRTRGGWWQRQAYLWETWLRNGLLKFFVRHQIETSGGVRWDRYIEKLIATSDYRKYDDTLRMVIAGTAAQREQLAAFLEAAYGAGRLVYGLHVSDRALVTCVVFERMGRQVHFVDGADGGYALAATDLKNRLRDKGSNPPEA